MVKQRIARITLVGIERFRALPAICGPVSIPALGPGVIVGGGALAAALILVMRIGARVAVMPAASLIVWKLVASALTVEKDGTQQGIPMPLWLPPLYLVIGLLMVAMAFHPSVACARREVKPIWRPQ